MRSLLAAFLSTPLLASALRPFETWGHERIQLAQTSIHFRYSDSSNNTKPPLLLVHGYPQHSPTWIHIGPILAEHYTVIAPDNRGMGESALANDGNYSAVAAAGDLYQVLNFLNISSVYLLSHDKGGGIAAALAFEHPDLVKKLVIAEYVLPGSVAYSTCVRSPQLYWDWQLAFFAVPDASEFFIRGREREMLSWYFYHGSYSGNSVIGNGLLDTYARSISKPGFLRSGLSYFATAWEDETYFKGKVNGTGGGGRLNLPVLALGGEASLGWPPVFREAFLPFVEEASLTVDVVPKAGHWIGDENPTWTANRVLQFFAEGNQTLSNVDLSALNYTITIFGNDGLSGGMLTPGINGTDRDS